LVSRENRRLVNTARAPSVRRSAMASPAPVAASGRVTQTRALSDASYCLTAKDIAALPVTLVPNPHYRSAAPMKLYEHEALLAAARAKHGGDAGIAAAAAARGARRAKAVTAAASRAAAQAAREAENERELTDALRVWGLQLRGDSALCEAYIKHGETDAWPLHASCRAPHVPDALAAQPHGLPRAGA
jgi:hypothetical protein